MNNGCIFLLVWSHAFSLLSSPVVEEQDSAAAQQYSRQGCPTGLRADLWALILNSTNQPQVMIYMNVTHVARLFPSGLLSLFIRVHTAAGIFQQQPF